ncbi:MAG: 3-dehydroquinate synthase [Cyclobacteriaceae bacterium]
MSLLPQYLTISHDPSGIIKSLIEKWQPDHVAILVDENTKKSCLPLLSNEGHLAIEIKSGEENKTLRTCEDVWSGLTQNQFTRKSLLINLGGGVIGDLGGFAASTFKRGIRFINIPTTLLSQVDASIGGKLGVDFGDLKNHVGLFKDPDHVIVDTQFLKTLNERELKSGFAEVLKHTLIADSEQWETIQERNFEDQQWDEIIPKSIAMKQKVVDSDPLEGGLRKILNFGHTLGHAIESYFLRTPNRLLHGEAIAIGMILESHISVQKGWLSKVEFAKIKNYIGSIYPAPTHMPSLKDLMGYLLQDKKNDSNGINFSLLSKIGKCEYDIGVSSEMITKSLVAYSTELK